MLRTPKESWWSVDATAGKLKLAPRAEELSGRGNPSYLGHRVQHAHFSASTELAVPVESNVSAGLAVFQGERFNCFAGVRREANGVVLFVEQTRGRASDVLKTERLDNMAKLQIRIVADDAKCRFEYAADGGEWKPLATDIDATLLTTDVAGGFVGATVGLYARFDGKLMPAPTVSHSDSKPGADFIAKAVRIKAGQSTPLTDSAGHVWLPDQGFEGGNVVGHDDSLTIAGTKEPALFQTEHYGMSAFACNIPNGKYTANLYFAETYDGITGAGQRVFSFDVQGREFKDFDVWAKAGGSNKAYVESIPVEVTNGVFRIRFVANNENPQINAVEIIPQG